MDTGLKCWLFRHNIGFKDIYCTTRRSSSHAYDAALLQNEWSKYTIEHALYNLLH